MIHVTATNLTIAMIVGHLLLNAGTIFKMLKCMLPKNRKPVVREALQAE
jgi:spore coat protein CotF